VTKYLIVSASIFAMMTGVGLAQSATNSETVTVSPAPLAAPPPAPPGNITVTRTRRTIDANGVERDSTQTYEKSQSFSSGNGVLSSDTRTQTYGQTTTVVPPPPVTTTTTTRTTTVGNR
jgi:hypothetical protein